MGSGFRRIAVAVGLGTMTFAAVAAVETPLRPAVDFRSPAIVPAPRALAYDAQVPVRLTEGFPVKIVCPEAAVGNWVAAQFKAWFGVTPKIVTDARIAAEVPTIEGAYQLVAKPGAIEIAARGTQGVKYALYTLRQAAERESRGSKLVGYWLPALTINDAPELGFRGLHLCWMPELSAAFIEHQLRLAAYYKFNVVVLESWGVFKSERHPELSIANAPLTVAEAGRLSKLAKELGVLLVPQINVFGHAAMARSCGGKHITLDVHPEMQPLFEPAGGWNWCLSNPAAREVLLDFLDEVHAAFGRPQFFHVGCDEADPPTCPTCRAVRPYAKLVSEHLRAVHDFLRARGARMLMWHDMLLEKGDARWQGFYANGSQEEAAMLETLPKDVVICDWYYGPPLADPAGKVAFPTLDHFRNAGFDTLTCPWRDQQGIRAQGRYARERGMFGMLETVWHHFRGQEFADMMMVAAQTAWGEGEFERTVWTTPFAVHWRQVGWDMGLVDPREHGYYTKQVTREIYD